MKNRRINIVILGARPDGHAKVVLEICEASHKFNVLGFIDDDPKKRGCKIRGYSVIGTSIQLSRIKKELGVEGCIVAIADNPIRRRLGEFVMNTDIQLINAIHPAATIASDVSIGRGVVCGAGSIINVGTSIGDHVNINTAATIDHDNIVDDGANISPGVHTAGRVHIGRDVFVGTGAIFIPDIKVGKGAIIGAGAVVIKDVEPYTVVAGVPAHVIKRIEG